MAEILTIKKIQQFLMSENIPYSIEGCCDIGVDCYSQLDNLEENKITWVKAWTEALRNKIEKVKNVVIVCDSCRESLPSGNCYIITSNPKMVFFEIIGNFYMKKEIPAKPPQNAAVKSKSIGKGCSIGDYVCIGEDVQIGEGVTIGSHAVIEGKVRIGNNAIIHSGAVIGKPGYGYYTDLNGNKKKVPHLGGVVIGDCVEIGANTCIDCGTMGDTVIGDGTKIDNLCHIGHNVQIKRNVLIVAGSILCGSCKIGDESYIAPGAVIKNQIQIGDYAFIGMQTAVMKDVGDEDSIFGVPGRKFKREYKV